MSRCALRNLSREEDQEKPRHWHFHLLYYTGIYQIFQFISLSVEILGQSLVVQWHVANGTLGTNASSKQTFLELA